MVVARIGSTRLLNVSLSALTIFDVSFQFKPAIYSFAAIHLHIKQQASCQLSSPMRCLRQHYFDQLLHRTNPKIHHWLSMARWCYSIHYYVE